MNLVDSMMGALKKTVAQIMPDGLLDWFRDRDEPWEIQTVQTHHPDAMPQCVAESIHHAAVSKKLSNALVFPNKSTY